MTTKRKRIKQYRAWCDQTRTVAYYNARMLALAIASGYEPKVPVYDLGIVLGADEVVWQRTQADYWWRGQQTWIEQRTSYYRHRSTLAEVRRPVMNWAGTLDWLITNQRVAAREGSGEVISIRWSAVQALSVDLPHDAVTLDGTDSYHGELYGPVAPIAVAAIACCHGPQALLNHPAVAALRTDLHTSRDQVHVARQLS